MTPGIGMLALAVLFAVSGAAASWAGTLRRKRFSEELLLKNKRIQGEQP
ncbi:hypothetical protein [Pseudomonas sp. PSKL.D1]|nr:hypothetical protein [Pseudomonas sp. PSKL.D1]WDY60377.1 hypothetical protein PVV54_12350 [Pseudomonas sp. PSKL.D1]